MLYLIGIIILAVIVLVWLIATYNSLISIRERVDNAKAQVSTQLESRWDAVQNLIQATKKYSKYEAEVLESVTEKRASIGKNSSIGEIENSERELEGLVGKLIAISENYPDLKASTVYETTMESVSKYEDYVRNARMIYNDTVTRLNRKIKMFPSSIVASLFRFEEREYFSETDSKRDMPSWE